MVVDIFNPNIWEIWEAESESQSQLFELKVTWSTEWGLGQPGFLQREILSQEASLKKEAKNVVSCDLDFVFDMCL